MKLRYLVDVDIKLDEGDLSKICEGEVLSGSVVGKYSERNLRVNVFSTDHKFYSFGGVGESFGDDVFNGWRLKEPREFVQLAFPWGEDEVFWDYDTLDVELSKPVLIESLSDGKGGWRHGEYLCGIARGVSSGHIIDRLNLSFTF